MGKAPRKWENGRRRVEIATQQSRRLSSLGAIVSPAGRHSKDAHGFAIIGELTTVGRASGRGGQSQ